MTVTDPHVQALQRSLQRTTRLTTALLVLFMLLVAGCSAFIAWEVHRFLNPEVVADRSEAYVMNNYPTWKQDLQKELVKSAPTLAQNITQRAMSTLPEAREELQEYLDRQIRASLEQDSILDEVQFRSLLRENRTEIQLGLVAAQFAPDEADEAAKKLEKKIDEQLGATMRKQAAHSMQFFDRINSRISRIARKKDLSAAEVIERRIARILRAFQEQAAERARVASRE